MTQKETYQIPILPLPYDLETKAVLRQLAQSHRRLAELKGLARTMPNEHILVSTLTLQEAKESSEVENIITTQNDVFSADIQEKDSIKNPAVKEVLNYYDAISAGYMLVKEKQMLTTNIIKQIQERLEGNHAGYRSAPVYLSRTDGVVVYTPPQGIDNIVQAMNNLENFINNETISNIDPLIKMAIIHHQFESIHPFFDGNGRTGRIVNILYLMAMGLLDYPILYLSRYITHHKGDYYRLIQAVRDKRGDNSAEWEQWILFMLRGIEETALDSIVLVKEINQLMANYKQTLRSSLGKLYSHDLLNNLFSHPFTKVSFLERDLMITNKTASRYLDRIVNLGLLNKMKIGRENYYINMRLMDVLSYADK